MAATYEPIASQTLGSDAASVTFSDIPSSYTDLVLVLVGRSDRTASPDESIKMTVNSDTGSNYSQTRLLATGSAASSDRSSSQTSMQIGRINDSASSNTTPSVCVAQFANYANTNVFKTVLGTSAASQETYGISRTVGLWRSTSAITALSVSPVLGSNFKSGFTASLYGIKAA